MGYEFLPFMIFALMALLAENDCTSDDDQEGAAGQGSGDDTIDAGSGDSSVIGGSGDDSVAANSGDDTVADSDTVWPFAIETTYNLAAGDDNLGGEPENELAYGGSGDDALSGNSGDDALFGDLGKDLLFGGDGADYLFGGSGDDTMVAWLGSGTPDSSDVRADDHLFGGDGFDRLILDFVGTGAEGYGGAGDDTLETDSSVSLFGEAGNDVLTSEGGSATLSGGSGKDILNFTQFDSVTGGDGADRFVADLELNQIRLGESSVAQATITDFNPSEDVLMLEIDRATFGANPEIAVVATDTAGQYEVTANGTTLPIILHATSMPNANNFIVSL